MVLTSGIFSFHTAVPWSHHNHAQIFSYDLWTNDAQIRLSDSELSPILQSHSHPLLAIYLLRDTPNSLWPKLSSSLSVFMASLPDTTAGNPAATVGSSIFVTLPTLNSGYSSSLTTCLLPALGLSNTKLLVVPPRALSFLVTACSHPSGVQTLTTSPHRHLPL